LLVDSVESMMMHGLAKPKFLSNILIISEAMAVTQVRDT